jgi:hypothetical protein
MGMLLTISLSCTLFCVLIVLPALLGPAPAPTGTRAAQPAENRAELPGRLRQVGGGRR